jgi:hypothetical protein
MKALLALSPRVIARFREVLSDIEAERRTFPLLFGLIDSHFHGIDHWVRVGIFCLANADRLDRVRLGDPVRPHLLYDDGAWPDLLPLAGKLLGALDLARAKGDLGILG